MLNDNACASNPSRSSFSLEFALSSVISATDEEMDFALDEDPALLARKFKRMYNNRRDRKGGNSHRCFECGDPDQYIADCPKKKGKNDYVKRNDYSKKYDSLNRFDNKKKNHVSRRDKTSRKIKKTIAHACVVALSDVDFSSSDGDSLRSEDKDARLKGKKKNKDFTGLCFMARGNEELSDTDSNTSEVETHESLTYKVEQLESALVKQDNLLRVASRENKDLKSKLESSHVEIASLKSLHDDTSALECESCSVVMDDYVRLKDVHAQVASQLESVSEELVELKASPSTSKRCHVCPKLVRELIVRSFMIKKLRTTRWAKPQHTVTPPPCVSSISL